MVCFVIRPQMVELRSLEITLFDRDSFRILSVFGFLVVRPVQLSTLEPIVQVS